MTVGKLLKTAATELTPLNCGIMVAVSAVITVIAMQSGQGPWWFFPLGVVSGIAGVYLWGLIRATWIWDDE